MENPGESSEKNHFGGDILINIYLDVVPSGDAILPTMSSKVIKYLIDSGHILKDLRELSSSKDHYKPFFISCLYHADSRGKRLYKTQGMGSLDAPIVVKSGSHLMARVSAVVPREIIGDLLGISGGVFTTSYGSFSVSLNKIEVMDLRELRIDLSKGVVVFFKTPTLLSPKMLLPPVKKIMDRYGKARVGYLALPVPGLIFAYALRLWNSSVPEDLRLMRPNDKDDIYSYRVAVMGTALTEVIDYRLVVETAIIGRDRNQRLRKARGFRGYISMNIHHKTTRKAMEKALALARHLGIGRGRGIGLGDVEILPRIARSGEERKSKDSEA